MSKERHLPEWKIRRRGVVEKSGAPLYRRAPRFRITRDFALMGRTCEGDAKWHDH